MENGVKSDPIWHWLSRLDIPWLALMKNCLTLVAFFARQGFKRGLVDEVISLARQGLSVPEIVIRLRLSEKYVCRALKGADSQ